MGVERGELNWLGETVGERASVLHSGTKRANLPVWGGFWPGSLDQGAQQLSRSAVTQLFSVKLRVRVMAGGARWD